jgi:exodeoxyribonuclease VII large subunit
MLRIIGERFPSHIRLYPALVQGDEAARDIARGIARLDADPEVDVIIVGRGGGAFEDLLPFSDERVVRAVAACATPIVSAVGHEIDFPLCDLAADVRAPTPTAAAQLVVPDRRELQSQLSAWQEELHRAFDRSLSDLEMSVGDAWASLADEIDARMEAAASRVETLRAGLTASHPAHRLERVADRVVALSGSLRFAMEQYLSSRERQVATQRTLVEQLGPQAQLSRGYAVVRRPAAGPVIRAAAQVCPGDPLEVILSEGRLGVRVEERR